MEKERAFSLAMDQVQHQVNARYLVKSIFLLCSPALLVLVLATVQLSVAGIVRLISPRATTPEPIAHFTCYFGYYAWTLAILCVGLATVGVLVLLFLDLSRRTKWTTIGTAIAAWITILVYLPLIGPYGCP
jgi:hypothetical protein